MENIWPNRKLLDLLGIDPPIIQSPMAGANGPAMAIAVCEAGGLGSLPCAMLDAAKVRAEIGVIRQRTAKPLNVNFFCHTPPEPDPAVSRAPFDESMCEIVEDLKPEVVSFHFGLPRDLLRDHGGRGTLAGR